ncbi:type II secretion system protein GspL [Propionivibrio sp.]|uniref:type II secretion system protein GspL n=1 Tax=Propionivibrio sp. TaxID=2212460 RepID=UPI003BF164AF
MNNPSRFSLLRVHLPAKESWSELIWSAFDAARNLAASGDATPANLPKHDALEIVLPAGRVSAHQLTLPLLEKKHLDSLIAQAMEDRLLGDKADAFYVTGPQTGNQRTIWVCSRHWLEAQLVCLSAAGLNPERIFPEYELLPFVPDTTPFALTADGYIFRTTEGAIGIVDAQATISLLTGRTDTQFVPDLYLLHSPASFSNMLTGRLAHFRQKAFDPRTLRRSAFMLAISCLLLLLSNVIHWRQLENREARLQHEIRQTFATTFPGTPIIDPALQWESKMREQASPSNSDALDAVLALATRLNVPIHPRRIEAGEGLVRITLTDTEVGQFKAQLDGAGRPESSPAETGFTRLQFRISR